MLLFNMITVYYINKTSQVLLKMSLRVVIYLFIYRSAFCQSLTQVLKLNVCARIQFM